jgi:hypothetical protein
MKGIWGGDMEGRYGKKGYGETVYGGVRIFNLVLVYVCVGVLGGRNAKAHIRRSESYLC